jgi:hypothetical protein
LINSLQVGKDSEAANEANHGDGDGRDGTGVAIVLLLLVILVGSIVESVGGGSQGVVEVPEERGGLGDTLVRGGSDVVAELVPQAADVTRGLSVDAGGGAGEVIAGLLDPRLGVFADLIQQVTEGVLDVVPLVADALVILVVLGLCKAGLLVKVNGW